jgi:hypothetical protein
MIMRHNPIKPACFDWYLWTGGKRLGEFNAMSLRKYMAMAKD